MRVDDTQALSQAVEAHGRGQLEKARRLYDAVLARQPGHADALNLRGVLAHQMGRTSDGLRFVDAARKRSPGNGDYHLNAGHLLLALRRYPAAEAAYRSAIRCLGRSAIARNNLGVALMHQGRNADAEAAFREAVAEDQAYADAWNNLGGVLLAEGRRADAESAFRRALELDPGDASAAANLRRLRSSQVPVWHFQMMNDAPRNAAYASAIASVVQPGDRVLEIGTGSGLLAMLAARAGAAEVITVEAQPAIAETARQIIAANGLADRITVRQGHSSSLATDDDPWTPADVLIAEVFDAALLGEGALVAIRDARERLLTPGARVLPEGARLWGQLVASDDLAAMASVHTVEDLDLSLFNAFAPEAFQLRLPADARCTPLSDPFEIFAFDFRTGDLAAGQRRVDVRPSRDGRADAVVVWFELHLGAGLTMSTAPGAAHSHWHQRVHPLRGRPRVRAGTVLAVECHHDTRELRLAALATG